MHISQHKSDRAEELQSALLMRLTRGKPAFILLDPIGRQPTRVQTVVEFVNWTGKIIVAPRSMPAELANREEVKRTGVYCLLGPDQVNSTRDKFYEGEADNVFKRLTNHDDDESKGF